MTTFEDLLHRNEVYSKTASPVPFTADLPPGGIPSILIYACLDFRMEPIDFLQIKPGEAFIVRNAGGAASNNLADFFFIDKFLQNQLKEVIIIHHDDCGVQHVSADEISADLKERFPEHCAGIDKLHFDMHDPDRQVDVEFAMKVKLLTDYSVENSVRKDVKFLTDCPFLRKDIAIRGFIYDLKTNKVTEMK